MITEQERKTILNNMAELLDEYDYAYDKWALGLIVDEWAAKKATLIEAFKKHPNYVDGKFLIAFDYDYERILDANAVDKFSKYIKNIATTDSYIENLPEDINKLRITQHKAWLPERLWLFICWLTDYINSKTLSQETTKFLNENLPQIHPHVGEKASRVINRFCTYLGYNKHPDYNREFAKFADALSPITIKRHTILSLNPLDYLTMSFGNSWASCHTIDKTNKRNMPNSYEGQYSSGTVSYMLDGSSMVFYTVDSKYDDTDYWTQPKINRQMFHWGEEKLVQGRLYPQDNDGNGGAYDPYRQIVQAIMSTVFNFPNLWKLSRGRDAASRYIDTEGTHYNDYRHYSNCTLSRIQDSENENSFTVGADPICISCGQRHECSENINCCDADVRTCECCGRSIYSEDDEYWVGDYCYCENCVTYCEDCGYYELNKNVTWVEAVSRYVCNSCLEDNYEQCEYCGRWEYNSDINWVDSTEEYVCDRCLRNKFTQCDGCGQYIPDDEIKYVDGDYYCEECCPEEEEEEE